MFKNQVIISLILLLLIVWVTFWLLTHPSKKDEEEYRRLSALNDSGSRELQKNRHFDSSQQRESVSKQILFFKDSERLQWRIHCKSSDLVYKKQGDSVELVEEMEGVSGQMQEKIVPQGDSKSPKQYLRTLEARDATYHYNSQELVAQKVTLKRYVLSGARWIEHLESYKPVMSGFAEKVDFSFSNKGPAFKASQLKATINAQETDL